MTLRVQVENNSYAMIFYVDFPMLKEEKNRRESSYKHSSLSTGLFGVTQHGRASKWKISTLFELINENDHPKTNVA